MWAGSSREIPSPFQFHTRVATHLLFSGHAYIIAAAVNHHHPSMAICYRYSQSLFSLCTAAAASSAAAVPFTAVLLPASYDTR
ncbi:hypothetical protein GALMADRAFT_256230 [Galerina marginata CBS 339.88]|uniref:Uncharacterized protein n=1 Tax=Galerina marginata (strain CBS 339.88) TaxID=685588 RepID=A0A067SMU3_GALM3|nr:hypothetical protein GALMADRAFT_256230 [Galerina marginata CBS 339.88]